MKKILFGMSACVALLSVAVAAEIGWPADFDSKVAARETAQADGRTSSSANLGAVDARQSVGGSQGYDGLFCGTFFDLYVSAGMAFDPAASVGLMIFIR